MSRRAGPVLPPTLTCCRTTCGKAVSASDDSAPTDDSALDHRCSRPAGQFFALQVEAAGGLQQVGRQAP